MKGQRFVRFLWIVPVLWLALSPNGAAGAKTILVPDARPTIQAGIDAAQDGDTVLVRNGTYRGPGNVGLRLYGKAITVRSVNGPERCIIDCEKVPGHKGFSGVSNGVISGFTIMNGRATNGAAIAAGASSTITNCILIGNEATSYGGAIYLADSSRVENCIIVNNVSSGSGGGISAADSVISGCLIAGNTAKDFGGGIHMPSSVTIEDCVIMGNSTGKYGGGVYANSGALNITRSVITENEIPGSYGYGGGLNAALCDLVLRDCVLSRNTVPGDGLGAGAYILKGKIQLINSWFLANETLFRGGGIYLKSQKVAPVIRHCTVASNKAGNGAGIYCFTSSPTIENSIFRDNAGREIAASPFGHPVVRYSDVQGGFEGEGNLDVNPLFVGAGDYHLKSTSPVIGAGEANGAVTTDIDGEARTAGVDMGADEYAPGTVSIQADHSTATEGDTAPATFRVARTGETTEPVTVAYSVMGTATPGKDYIKLPGTLTIPAGKSVAVLSVRARDDAVAEPTEYLMVTLAAGDGYTVGMPRAAAVRIVDNDTP